MSPVNHNGLYQGWKQTPVCLPVIYSTSHYTTSLFFSNHNSNCIQNFGTQTQKNNNTYFWACFIFRGHSTREPASSVCNNKTCLFCGSAHLVTANTRKPLERFEKNAGEWTGRVEISKEKISGSRCSIWLGDWRWPLLRRPSGAGWRNSCVDRPVSVRQWAFMLLWTSSPAVSEVEKLIGPLVVKA